MAKTRLIRERCAFGHGETWNHLWAVCVKWRRADLIVYAGVIISPIILSLKHSLFTGIGRELLRFLDGDHKRSLTSTGVHAIWYQSSGKYRIFCKYIGSQCRRVSLYNHPRIQRCKVTQRTPDERNAAKPAPKIPVPRNLCKTQDMFEHMNSRLSPFLSSYLSRCENGRRRMIFLG